MAPKPASLGECAGRGGSSAFGRRPVAGDLLRGRKSEGGTSDADVVGCGEMRDGSSGIGDFISPVGYCRGGSSAFGRRPVAGDVLRGRKSEGGTSDANVVGCGEMRDGSSGIGDFISPDKEEEELKLTRAECDEKLGILLEKLHKQMQDKQVRHINNRMREMVTEMRRLKSCIEQSVEKAVVSESVCSKCAQASPDGKCSVNKGQQTTALRTKNQAVQTDPRRGQSQPEGAVETLDRPGQAQQPARKPPARTTARAAARMEPEHRQKGSAKTAGPVSAVSAVTSWSTVVKKKKPSRRTRPDAVVVEAAGKTYNEVLAMVTRRDDNQLSDLGSAVNRVRRTAKGNLLLEVAKGSKGSAESMRDSISRVLGDAAEVRALTEDSKVCVFVLRDLDAITSESEIRNAFTKQYQLSEGAVKVRSLRLGYGDSKTAVISLPCSMAREVRKRGEIRIGWTQCRVREREGPPRCFRCLELGHIASRCRSLVDRSGCCIRAAQDLLQQTVREVSADVAFLSEPYREREGAEWASDRTGKAALWLCGDRRLRMSSIREADGFVRAEVGGFWMYSCYLAPSLPLEAFSRILDELCYDLRGRANVIVGGDFNAWAQEWGSTATNARGRVVLEAFASTDVVLLNHGERHTFVRAGAASIIDLTFASSAISHNVKWEISDAYTGSDHEAILCSVGESESPRAVLRPNKAYRPDTLCTQKFTEALEGMSADESVGANELANQTAALMECACDRSMRLRGAFRRNKRPMFWWSDTIADLRSTCLRARRRMTRARGSSRVAECSEAYKMARKTLKIAIRDAKRDSFLRLCDEAENDPWGGAYRLVVKGLKAGSTAPSDPDTLDGIVQALFPRGAPVTWQSSAVSHSSDAWAVSDEEVTRMGRSVRPKKAPGPDAVPNRALKLAIALHPTEFAGLYSRCLEEGTFPACSRRSSPAPCPRRILPGASASECR
ncbi:uncharacterized protein [Drosophila kikkawai]|uniref:CCHC-type domain-containing protein n=1 Tax=Drosophila kikkawai TaxID=30033 RepID=A0ABM4GHB8_DROKI